MNSANGTETESSAEEYIFASGTLKLLAFTIGIIGVFGFCNNVIVLVLYYKFKRLRTPTNLLLVNISISDLLVSLFGINFTFASCIKGGWVWNSPTCIWDGFSNSLFGVVSIMSLSTLAYERYIRVVHAKVVDFPWAWKAITQIWLYSLAWTGVPLFGWNQYVLETHQLGCSLDWSSKDPNDSSYIIFFLLACFFVPIGIMAYCYGNILYTVRMLQSIQDLQTAQVIKVLCYEKKVTAMFLLMISCFLVCWTPYAVVSMLEAFGKKKVITPSLSVIPSFLAKSSTMYNFLIYITMSRKFRRCLLQLLCSRLLRLQQSIKERPLPQVNQPIRPIVVSHRVSDRPKKRVTFSSSSIVFIITSNDTQQLDVSPRGDMSEVNVIQVRPL
ncbi:opsin-3 isoform X1 [Paramormyrops kingsleyae]|uniref:Opsin-3 n=2 Tax=Paramormyrops kingsleyae TaxID=1676925 RepID=A0A3B3T704_9TELE|nr:opsin-3 isoform X1 [Paramormyrops kingsleyae]